MLSLAQAKGCTEVDKTLVLGVSEGICRKAFAEDISI